MIVRSVVRRRHLSRSLALSFSQLNLPWLAPAQLRWISSQSETPSRRRRRPSHGRLQSRNLATAVEQHQVSSDIPFESQSPAFEQFSLDQYGTGFLSSSRQPIVLDTSTTKPDPAVFVSTGFNGSKMDLFQHLHTSLRIGRYDRARMIIKRLTPLCEPSSPDLTNAHYFYLRAISEEWIQDAQEDIKAQIQANKRIQRWFEQEIVKQKVAVNGPILSIMVRSAIGCMEEPDKAIQKYVKMAEEIDEDAVEEVLYSDSYTDDEYDVVMRVMDMPRAEEDAAQEPFQEQIEDTILERADKIDKDALPDVLETAQQGSGLQGVKDSLKSFTDFPSSPANASPEERKALAVERQIAMEQTAVEIATQRWRESAEQMKKAGIKSAWNHKPIGALMWEWYSAILPKLEEEIEKCKNIALERNPTKDLVRIPYAAHIQLLPARDLAASTILYVISRIANQRNIDGQHASEVKLANLSMSLAKQIELECNSNSRLRKNMPAWRSTKPQTTKSRRVSRTAPEIEDLPKQILAWPSDVKAKLGGMLIEKLIECAEIPVNVTNRLTGELTKQFQPAFLHRIKYLNGKRLGFIIPNSALLEKLESEPVGSLLAKRLPMIVEPLPWSEWEMGGYYHYPTPIMRLGISDFTARDYFQAADKQGDMAHVYAGLNALSKVPWRINHDVLKAQLEAWNSGEAIANFAPLHPKFEHPPEPKDNTDPNARRKWLTEVRELDDKISGLHSKRCFQNFQMEIARTMANETLYFPHNMDFRGRAYPVPPYLNHMGADNARAMLVFANGKELGVQGLRWLKIHLSNVFGYDKASLQEREDFAMEHLDDIRDSVRDPFGGRRWWLKSEDAWQTLAACYELVNALDSPDPTKFVSHLPVHQDGTCNGLQHYAALGGDKAGAAQVNLEPGDRPADIYAAVAAGVNAEVEKDAANGNPIAKFLQGHVTRKLVKQPVMTNVYGVTLYGAKAQVRKQLEDIFPNVRRFDDINYGVLSAYVAGKIFISLGQLFKGAQAIQSWLGDCAELITSSITPEQIKELLKPPEPVKRSVNRRKQIDSETQLPVFKSSVIWTTPLRLPVVQPYRKAPITRVNTPLQRIVLAEPKVWHPVSPKKQLQGFPPNFIHSLDATHMMLSAIKCDESGLTFASIHDSFWTHACDISTLSTVLRDAFVAMHSDNITGRLLEEFRTRYKGCMQCIQIRRNHKLYDEMKEWRKQNRHLISGHNAELKLEVKRLTLLDSDVPEEREEGQKMETPASIFEAYSSRLSTHSQSPAQTLGNLSNNEDALSKNEDLTDDLEDSVEIEDSDKKQVALGQSYNVWLPLRFPEVPEKGDFDVTRLRESKYFFH